MKSLFSSLLFCCLLLTFGCGGQQADSTDTTDTTDNTENTDNTASTDNTDTPAESTYSTTVLKSDIASPRKEMTGTVGSVQVTVNYGSPAVKGREIWGGLVPFGELWRTGANEATTIKVDDASVEGKALAAGKYSIFTVPNKDSWEIVFNSVAEQWGAYDYDKDKDVLRVSVTPTTAEEAVENLNFIIENDALVLQWENLRVPIKIGAGS